MYILNNYLYIDCIVVISHTDDGNSSDWNMWWRITVSDCAYCNVRLLVCHLSVKHSLVQGMEHVSLEFCYCNYHAFCRILLHVPNKCTIYINNICFLKHSDMFRCLYIMLRESRIMYTKVTKLIKWKHLYRWLLWKISRLKPLKCCKMCQVVCNSWNACFITVHRTLLCGWWLYIQSLESGIVFLVGSGPFSTSSCVKVVPHTGRYTTRDWAHKKNSKLYWLYVQPPTTKQCSG